MPQRAQACVIAGGEDAQAAKHQEVSGGGTSGAASGTPAAGA
jgi:hypothetical protein